MIARSGVFGALVILALITATLAIARPLKKIQSSKNHILSAAIGCVFVYITFPFSAPQMSQIKIIATLGILIGLASRLQLGADWFRSRTLKVELVNHSSKLARDGCKRGTEAGTCAH